ncbi:hypothetical protein [Sphingobium sp.]|uniref:hypothetical protein n=1 Tax=Sphingobium sp. TaxID=1912891 RepID=UPI002605A43A|nr:hypothetical protein [Sphingobium sp.]
MTKDPILWQHAMDRARECFLSMAHELGDASMAASAMVCVGGDVMADVHGHAASDWISGASDAPGAQGEGE